MATINDPMGSGKTLLDENLGIEARIEIVKALTEKWEARCLSQPEIWEQPRVRNYFDALATYVLKVDFNRNDGETDEQTD